MQKLLPDPPILIHPNAKRGYVLFNQGQYFDAHEELEIAWRAEKSPYRELYRGVLQVGVAYLHIQRGNYSGAKKMLERAAGWLEPFPDICLGINVNQLKIDALQTYSLLIELGSERIQQFNPVYFRPLEMAS
jgi:predicted metal-dependent hydrolase